MSLKTAGWSFVRNWRFVNKQAIVLGPGTMVAKTNTIPIQENNSGVKKFTIAANSKTNHSSLSDLFELAVTSRNERGKHGKRQGSVALFRALRNSHGPSFF